MPVKKKSGSKNKYKWGGKPKAGTTKKKAAAIGRAAYANGRSK